MHWRIFMQVFDASSIIYAWDNYPILQFPGLWEWIATQIFNKTIVMPDVAIAEVTLKTPDCAIWLQNKGIETLPMATAILQKALQIKHLLGIINDNYHSKGVGENDLFIIATSVVYSAELVSNENRQNRLPDELRRMKIPAVCNMNGVGIVCINFLEFIKRSNAVFR